MTAELTDSQADLASPEVLTRTNVLFDNQQHKIHQQTDRLFAWLMLFQWAVSIIIALCVSPQAWAGTLSDIHIHVWAALFIGGAITLFPVALALLRPGRLFTRHVIGASQMLMSALLIHLSGGRIETHFHVFGSLAFLAFYRDPRVLITASLVVALDHGLRGIFWPQSVYGALGVEPWRWLEHTGWVVFEDVFLIISIKQSLNALKDVSFRQAELERLNQVFENRVVERTAELQAEVNDRKQAQAELAESNLQLENLSKDLEKSRDQAIQASRFKSEFLANTSHEIRTPLNAVIGMSDLLLRTPLSAEQRDFGAVINNSAEVLLGIVNDILDYSKIESGRLDLEIIDFDIVEMVEGAAEIVAEKARSKQLSLATFIDPAIPRKLRGDPGRIRQILLNFLSNSIKFTDKGEIVIRANLDSSLDEKLVRINFSVRDTGIGLNDSAREFLFQPFTQADASITRRYGGTGLGLAISRRLVELMDGSIEFDSVYGAGATFGFTIELERSTEQPAPVFSQPEHLNDARILLLDGPAGAQQLMNAYIVSWGMRCSATSDVDKAVQMLRREASANDPFDVVFVVLEAGNLEPLKILHEVQNHSQLAKTKLVVISNSADREFAKQTMRDGFSAYLSMPTKQSKLFNCLVSLLQADQVASIETEELEAEKTTIPEPQSRNLVLVVEDNATNQKVALLQLRELGLAAHAVGNGLEALDAVSRTQYALILMDCQMPEMDGLQATREIRKLEALTGKHSPIIAMTAHAMSSDRLECLAAGMDDYISKPVSHAKLAEVINRWLPRSSNKAAEESDTVSGAKTATATPIEIEVLISTFGERVAFELLGEFFVRSRETVLLLEHAVKNRDVTAVKDLTHDLKGSSATLYVTEVAELSRSLEETIRQENFTWEDVQEKFSNVESAWSRAKEYSTSKTI